MSFFFNVGAQGISEQSLAWEGATTLRAILLKGSGTPLRSNATVAAVLAESNVEECDATNYSRQTVSNPVVSQSGNKQLFDADQPSWTDLGGDTNNQITGALFYLGSDDPMDDGTNIPVLYQQFTAPATTDGTPFTWLKHSTDKFGYMTTEE